MADFLSKTWQFTQKITEGNLARIPSGCKKFTLGHAHGINLDKAAGKTGKVEDECIVYNEFELDQATDLGFGAGADWWFKAWLNGELIFSTFPAGNSAHPCDADNFSFYGRGKKGRNLLAVRVKRGVASWDFYLKEKPYSSAHPSAPVTFTADPKKITGAFKPMNAVNNGPIKSSRGRGNMELWKAAAIPYVRNHDASFTYGVGHTVDVHLIFTDFSKDPDDPASYDFTLTDRYLNTILEGGSKIFYRLGSKIEHECKKYGTVVPPDFKKWAVICEHIIRHYNEGWADGFKMNIEYWEIWNEPDLPKLPDGSSCTWQGTPEQFFEFYTVAATHLKKCFPKLKIGGPSLGTNLRWMQNFLTYLTAGKKRVPLDFFSWHKYSKNPIRVKADIFQVRQLLDAAGYTQTESILNEWNYLRGWSGEPFSYTIRSIIGLKGAAYAAAVMCIGQQTPLDMLMYYDARPCSFNGLFGYYNFEPLKTYYVYSAWAKLAEMGKQIAVDTREKNGIFAVGATDGSKTGILISRFFEEDQLPEDLPVTFSLKKGDLRGARLFLIDETHDLTEIPYRMDKNGNLLFTMKANTIIYLEK